MSTTKIEWADRVWNPITGCTKCSPACDNCYAERMSKRLAGRCGYPPLDPFAVTLHPDKTIEPLGWKKPARIFDGSMTDLFHPGVPFEWVDKMLVTIGLTGRHTHMWLTKRPERMAEYFAQRDADGWMEHLEMLADVSLGEEAGCSIGNAFHGHLFPQHNVGWPMRNLWLGTTIWDQESADRAVPILLSTPAGKRFVSIEPMLGPVVLRQPSVGGGITSALAPDSTVLPRLDWVICGGETGPGARPMHPDWPRSLRDQCQAAGVPFFFKQWGEWGTLEGSGAGGNTPVCYWDETIVGTQPGWQSGISSGGQAHMVRLGKSKAGRVLDGRTWEEVPNA